MDWTKEMVDRVLAIVEDLYQGAIEDQAWLRALAGIRDFIGAKSITLVSFGRDAAGACVETVGVDPKVLELYGGYYGAKDVLGPVVLAMPVGAIATEAAIGTSQFRRTEIFNDLYRPSDIGHIMGTAITRSALSSSSVALQRSVRQGEFQRSEIANYQALVPHLVRAANLRRLLSRSRSQGWMYLEAIDRLPFGVLFIDRYGRVVEASRLGRQTLAEGTALTYSRLRLRARYTEDDRALQRLIGAALHARLPAQTDVVALRRLHGIRPLVVCAAPISAPLGANESEICAVLLLLDPDIAPVPQVESVKQGMRLTSAEARLVCELLKGFTLRETAENLGTSINTCKAQLKSIYSKTHCRSQADLARMMLMLGLFTHAGPRPWQSSSEVEKQST